MQCITIIITLFNKLQKDYKLKALGLTNRFSGEAEPPHVNMNISDHKLNVRVDKKEGK